MNINYSNYLYKIFKIQISYEPAACRAFGQDASGSWEEPVDMYSVQVRNVITCQRVVFHPFLIFINVRALQLKSLGIIILKGLPDRAYFMSNGMNSVNFYSWKHLLLC